MIPVTLEILVLIASGKVLENESMRKEKWRPGGDEIDYRYEMDGK